MNSFYTIQQRDFVQDSIDAVLHAQHTYQYPADDFDFLHNNKAIFSEEEKEPLDQEASDDCIVRAKSRDYV